MASFIVSGEVLAQSLTAHFKVTKSFSNNSTESVGVTLSCNGGIPMEQSYTISEGNPVSFAVRDFVAGETDCEVEEQGPSGIYNRSYDNGTVVSDTSCLFTDIEADSYTCAISNESTATAFTTLSVYRVFSDENPADIEVQLNCGNAVAVAPSVATSSEESPAVFEIGWDGSGPDPTCTASEIVSIPGYTSNNIDCKRIKVPEGDENSCTIKKEQSRAVVYVSKYFADANPVSVAIDLECTSGDILVERDEASIESIAKFYVANMPHDGTDCSATADTPVGYELQASTCSDLSAHAGGLLSCEIASSPVTPEEADRTAITGSWYDPSTSGEGLMVHSTSEDSAVAYFYGYDNEGGRLWLIGQSEGPIEWGEPVIFETQYANGGSFTDFDADQVMRDDWGTIEITQWDCESATVQMAGAHGDKLLRAIKLAATSGSDCSGADARVDTDGMTGSWYEAETSGQGFSVHKAKEDRGVIYFYGYDDDGENLWLIGVWEEEWQFGQEVIIEMQQAIGGTFDHVDPEMIVRETWGTLSFRFDDCTTGWAKLDGLHGMQELNLELLAGSFGLDCPASN